MFVSEDGWEAEGLGLGAGVGSGVVADMGGKQLWSTPPVDPLPSLQLSEQHVRRQS